jgi:hypothetical protein
MNPVVSLLLQGLVVGVVAALVFVALTRIWHVNFRSLKTGLAWIAAVAGTLAAIGGFWAAIATGYGASATVAQVNLESKPVLVLSCAPEFLMADTIDRITPPKDVLFERPDVSDFLPVDPNIPTYTHDGLLFTYPAMFYRCTLTNGGRLPLVAIEEKVTFLFYPHTNTPMGIDDKKATKGQGMFSVATLAPGQSTVFAVANSVDKGTRIAFSRKVSLTRVDTEASAEVHLFVDRGVSDLEHFVQNSAPLQSPPPRKKP